MTEHIDRDELRKLTDAVPSGPWYAHPAGRYVYSADEGGLVQNWNGDWNALAGMEFIAAARTAIPALLDALDQAEAALRAVRELHEESGPINRAGWTKCLHCSEKTKVPVLHPCPTVRALDGDPTT